MRRALTYNDVVAQKFEDIPFTGPLQKAFGNPSYGGSWFAWADSGNGKSSLAMILAREFCLLGKRVVYDALEEYRTKGFQDRVVLYNMAEVKKNFHIVKEQVDELRIRCSKKRAPHVVILDSIQYLRCRKDKLFALFEDFPEITFIIISQAEKGIPRGTLASDCNFEAHHKIYIEQHKAYYKGRGILPPDAPGVFDIYFDAAEKLGHQKIA